MLERLREWLSASPRPSQFGRWKPEYDALADYNGVRNLAHNAVNEETRERHTLILKGYSPEFVARMATLQEDYNVNFLGHQKKQFPQPEEKHG